MGCRECGGSGVCEEKRKRPHAEAHARLFTAASAALGRKRCVASTLVMDVQTAATLSRTKRNVEVFSSWHLSNAMFPQIFFRVCPTISISLSCLEDSDTTLEIFVRNIAGSVWKPLLCTRTTVSALDVDAHLSQTK